jgi:hypothetical protein
MQYGEPRPRIGNGQSPEGRSLLAQGTLETGASPEGRHRNMTRSRRGFRARCENEDCPAEADTGALRMLPRAYAWAIYLPPLPG